MNEEHILRLEGFFDSPGVVSSEWWWLGADNFHNFYLLLFSRFFAIEPSHRHLNIPPSWHFKMQGEYRSEMP